MTKVVAIDSHMNFNGWKYFAAGSEKVSIGCYGKKTPIFGMNKLEVQDHFPYKKMKISNVTCFEIDTSKSTEANFSAGFNLVKVLGASFSPSYKNAKAKKFKLLQLHMMPGDMKDAVNDSNKHRGEFSDLGNDARVVNEIFIATEWEEAERIEAGAGFEASVNAGVFELNFEVGAKHKRQQSVSIVANTCAFYGLLEADWDKNSKKKRDKVTKFSVDEWGVG